MTGHLTYGAIFRDNIAQYMLARQGEALAQ
jgi:hypothetical protein